METQTFDGHLERPVELDICTACRVFWFDQRESLQLSPGATLRLFSLIGREATAPRQPLSAVTKCPRCASQLVPTHDLQRNVAFQYRRCPHGHGRLTTYFDFLREKNFVRPLSAEQLKELRQNVQSVNCSNCGAAIDLATSSTCGHCGSPLSLLDLKQAGLLIEQLQKADSDGRTVDPALPMRLEQARREVEASFAALRGRPNGFATSSDGDLLTTGLSLLARLLTP